MRSASLFGSRIAGSSASSFFSASPCLVHSPYGSGFSCGSRMRDCSRIRAMTYWAILYGLLTTPPAPFLVTSSSSPSSSPDICPAWGLPAITCSMRYRNALNRKFRTTAAVWAWSCWAPDDAGTGFSMSLRAASSSCLAGVDSPSLPRANANSRST